MLTKNQLEKIQEIIRKRFLRLTYETVGDRALTEAELVELKKLDSGFSTTFGRRRYDNREARRIASSSGSS